MTGQWSRPRLSRRGGDIVMPALGLALLAIVAARFLAATLAALDVFADYHAYYRAAGNLRAGADLYAEGKLLLARNSYDFWTQTDGQYVYPPLLALLLLPLTALDAGKGGVVWLLALTLAALVFVWMVTHILGRPLHLDIAVPGALLALGGLPLLLGARYGLVDRFLLLPALLAMPAYVVFRTVTTLDPAAFRLPASAPSLAAAIPAALPTLGAAPLLLGIKFGQIDVILLALTTLSLLAYLRGRDALAGVALGLAAAVKPTLAVYGLFYLRKGRWATLGAAILTGLLLGFGPFALLGAGALADWLAVSRYFTGADYPTYPSNQSLRGLLLRAFAGGPRHVPLLPNRPLAEGLWIVGALGALALWWWLVSRQPRRDGRAVLEYALTATLMLFAAPLSEDVHYVALLLPLAVLAYRAARGPASVRSAVLAVLACLYFAQPWLDAVGERGGADWQRLLTSSVYLYGLLLAGAALISLLRDRAATPDGIPDSPSPVDEPVGERERAGAAVA